MRLLSIQLAVLVLAAAPIAAPASGAPHPARGFVGRAPTTARVRWAERDREPLRVYLERGDPLLGWTAGHDVLAWQAFRQWSGAGIPVRFERVADADGADVVVSWVGSLAGSAIGRTRVLEREGVIVHGHITLSLADGQSRVIPTPIQRGAMLHEIGHLLGLEHSADRQSVMYKEVWTTQVTAADLEALRRLYGGRALALAR